jgi:hypothetical protein
MRTIHALHYESSKDDLKMSSLAVASSTVHTYTTRGGRNYFLYYKVQKESFFETNP